MLEALPVEQISLELQKQRLEKLGRSATASEALSSENQSGTSSVIDDDGKSSKSMQSSSFVHASQASDGANTEQVSSSQPRKNKAQLWSEMKIDCKITFYGFLTKQRRSYSQLSQERLPLYIFLPY